MRTLIHPAGWSLRVRLTTVALTFVAIALVLMSVTSVVMLQNYSLSRLDEQLAQVAHSTTEQALHQELLPGDDQSEDAKATQPKLNPVTPNPTASNPSAGAGNVMPPNPYYIKVTDMAGAVVFQTNQFPNTDLTPPTLPTVSVEAANSAGPTYTTVESNGNTWRVLTQPIHGPPIATGGVATSLGVIQVAQTTGDIESTIHQLLMLELVAGLILILGAGLGAYFTVKSSLKPLTRVEDTYDKVAGGDLSVRADGTYPNTEAGKVAVGLNAMLDQLEDAFLEREQATLEAVESEDRMRTFIADASHELRTPLTSIRGFAELYRQGAIPAGSELDRVMGRVENEALRMGLLVEDLLLLARMDEERPLKEEVVDMETLVDDVALDTRAQDPERLIEVTKDIKIEALVLGDEMRLRQVLSNLTRNAITHTPKGSPIYLSLKTKDTSVVIVVKDEGPGLTLEQQEHIFDRFYRVDKSRTRAQGGAGLGLSIVSSLVKAHNGTIEVDSIEGEGATFTLTLPLLTLEQDEEES